MVFPEVDLELFWQDPQHDGMMKGLLIFVELSKVMHNHLNKDQAIPVIPVIHSHPQQNLDSN